MNISTSDRLYTGTPVERRIYSRQYFETKRKIYTV